MVVWAVLSEVVAAAVNSMLITVAPTLVKLDMALLRKVVVDVELGGDGQVSFAPMH
jgi:hypothetical protein